jgi:hypothetical protein
LGCAYAPIARDKTRAAAARDATLTFLFKLPFIFLLLEFHLTFASDS